MLRMARWAFNCSSWSPTEAQLVEATCRIQPEEKLRIGRFVYQRDAKASLVGRLLMRKYVSEATGIPSGTLHLGRDPRGKPFLEDATATGVSFNVSHQGDYAVLVGEPGSVLLGVDIMPISSSKNVPEFFRLMSRQFSVREWDSIRLGPERQQLACFYRHWCLKESYVKATGTGIGVPLDSISFKVHGAVCHGAVQCGTELELSGSRADGWSFQETMLDPGHSVAVAVMPYREPVLFTVLQYEQLVQGLEPVTEEDPLYCRQWLGKELQP